MAMISTESIGWFADLTLADRPTVGGKGGSLGELTRAGIAVPEGFVVRTAAFEQFIAELERVQPLRSRVELLDADDLDAITALSTELIARVQSQTAARRVARGTRRRVPRTLCRRCAVAAGRTFLPPPLKTPRTQASPACRTPICG